VPGGQDAARIVAVGSYKRGSPPSPWASSRVNRSSAIRAVMTLVLMQDVRPEQLGANAGEKRHLQFQ